MFSVSIPNSATLLALVETATKCLGIARSSPSADSTHSRAERALVIVSSVVNVLVGDDQQRLLRVQITRRFNEVGPVDVREEPERQPAVGVVAQRLIGHHWPEIRAPDPDVDDVADPSAGVAGPGAAAHALAERRHPIEYLMDLRDHVDAVEDQRAAP